MVQPDGTLLLQPDGRVALKADGRAQLSDGVSDECCCEGPAPCVCPCSQEEWEALVGESHTRCANGGLWWRYRIIDYEDGDVPAGGCSDCFDETLDNPWDGWFTGADPFPGACCWPPDWTTGTKIDGKKGCWGAGGDPCLEGGITLVDKGGGDCVWRLAIPCCGSGTGSGWVSIWEGEHNGAKPDSAAFIRTGGCGGGTPPDSLWVEKF